MKIILGIIVGIIAIIELTKVLIGLLTIGHSQKTKCKSCSQKMDATLIKCSACGTFLEMKWKKHSKVVTYMENRTYEGLKRYIKKNNFYNDH
jgi:tRNA(Ile2) C34 agmatinyltransferase TiaS